MDDSLVEMLKAARQAVEEVGAMVIACQRDMDSIRVERKGEGDFVTNIDLRAEQMLRTFFHQRFPEHGFLGEESAGTNLDAACVWVVDPIDGTSNYAAGLTPYAVSVACLRAGMPIVAAVRCAPEAATYSAVHGGGAFHGERRLRTGPGVVDDAAILGVQWHRGTNDLGFLPSLLRSGTRIRTFGCSVTQLCDVASGRLQGNVQEQGRIWDIAAAGLIVREAGSQFTDWQGHPIFPVADLSGDRHYPSLAAPQPAHGQILSLLTGGHSSKRS